MFGDPLQKAARLERLEQLLCSNPKGLSAKYLAEYLGVTPRTIQRDVITLQADMGIPVDVENHCYVVHNYQLKLSLDLNEAIVFLVAARLYARNSDEHNPHADTALLKLASCLPDPMKKQVERTAGELRNARANQVFVDAIEDLAMGWYRQEKVRVGYRSMSSEDVHEHVFSPYFMEAYGAARSTYAIGKIDAYDEIRTLKVERIAWTEPLDEEFEIPQDVDFTKLLSSAWGVMWGDGQLTKVVLRFSPSVCRAVKETGWHPSQVIEDLPDGGCRLSVSVGDSREMEAWIMGWGSLVEVEGPADLRAKLADDLRRAAEIYAGTGLVEESNK
jgi:predicted DNA-binding transcriptional regulator YafY